MVWRHFIPTKVYFGEGALHDEKNALADLGKRALIITGKSSSRNGSLKDLTDSLESIGVDYEVYDRVKENPSFDMLREARKLLKDLEVDFIVGVGGGSPMDFSKALSVLLKNPNLRVPEIYDTHKYSSMYPVVAVPTTSGTGSEVTQYSVITDDEGNKRGFGADFTFPTLSFVDPRYTVTMPKDLTISTGVDALCHAVEGFVSKKSTPLVRTMALEAVEKIAEHLQKSVEDPKNMLHRSEMMYASMLAGMVISQSGTTVNHAFGYPLTSFKGIRHGQATGLFLPETLRVMMKTSREKVERILRVFGGIEGLEEFLEKLGIYDIKVEISLSEIENWAKKTSKAKHLAVTEGDFDFRVVLEIYETVARKIS